MKLGEVEQKKQEPEFIFQNSTKNELFGRV